MEVELTVTYKNGVSYLAIFKGDEAILQSALIQYTNKLLMGRIDFKITFSFGDLRA
jgi:hypothetical protein